MYKITFVDNSIYMGKSFDGSWNRMPEKLIKKMEYFFPKNKKLVLHGYDAYNHSYTCYEMINSGTKKITMLYLMARKNNQVITIVYDFVTKKAMRYFSEFKKELKSPIRDKNKKIIGWGQEQHVTGWRDGNRKNTPKAYITDKG